MCASDSGWGRSIGPEGAKALAKALESGKCLNIARIDLYNNRVGSEGAKALAKALESGMCSNIAKIDLMRNEIGSEGAEALAKALESGKCSNIANIFLDGNRIGSEGTKALVNALESGKCSNIAGIDLSKNQIGSEGAEALAKALESGKCSNVTYIDLRDNRIGPEGAKALAKALESGKCANIANIYLGRNGIGPEEAKHIIEALKSGNSFAEFDLDYNDIPEELLQEIKQLEKENKQVFDLIHKPASDIINGTQELTLDTVKNWQENIRNANDVLGCACAITSDLSKLSKEERENSLYGVIVSGVNSVSNRFSGTSDRDALFEELSAIKCISDTCYKKGWIGAVQNPDIQYKLQHTIDLRKLEIKVDKLVISQEQLQKRLSFLECEASKAFYATQQKIASILNRIKENSENISRQSSEIRGLHENQLQLFSVIKDFGQCMKKIKKNSGIFDVAKGVVEVFPGVGSLVGIGIGAVKNFTGWNTLDEFLSGLSGFEETLRNSIRSGVQDSGAYKPITLGDVIPQIADVHEGLAGAELSKVIDISKYIYVDQSIDAVLEKLIRCNPKYRLLPQNTFQFQSPALVANRGDDNPAPDADPALAVSHNDISAVSTSKDADQLSVASTGIDVKEFRNRSIDPKLRTLLKYIQSNNEQGFSKIIGAMSTELLLTPVQTKAAGVMSSALDLAVHYGRVNMAEQLASRFQEEVVMETPRGLIPACAVDDAEERNEVQPYDQKGNRVQI